MPASPIVKEITPPDNWVHLQKTMIPAQATGCYWSVWYDHKGEENIGDEWVARYADIGTAWLMWCAIGEDPSVNDSWCHAEEIDESCRNVLTAIEAVHGCSFHDSIMVQEDPSE